MYVDIPALMSDREHMLCNLFLIHSSVRPGSCPRPANTFENMAPLARKLTPAKRRTGLRLPSVVTLLVLLAGGGDLLQGAGGQTCDDQDNACLENAVCENCILGFKVSTAALKRRTS